MTEPIAFSPLFMERVWGGRRLAEVFDKQLPDDALIGESWELADREDDQSARRDDPATTLHDLWTRERKAVFGARGVASSAPRFPILVKLLDAEDTLSVQVHPTPEVASELGGEPKNEMWFMAAARPGAHIYAGLRAGADRAAFERALADGEDVSVMLHRIEVAPGDAFFIPSGRVHAIGAGCLIVEIQQNSDTTYRVFDFNRPDLDGELRELHVEQSMRCIDFEDIEPALTDGPIVTPFFATEHWTLEGERAAAPPGECAVVIVLDGEVKCGRARFGPGELFLVPASDPPPLRAEHAELLRVLLPA